MKGLENFGDWLIVIGVFILFPIVCYSLSDMSGELFVWLLLSMVLTGLILTFASPLILIVLLVLELFLNCFSALANKFDNTNSNN